MIHAVEEEEQRYGARLLGRKEEPDLLLELKTAIADEGATQGPPSAALGGRPVDGPDLLAHDLNVFKLNAFKS